MTLAKLRKLMVATLLGLTATTIMFFLLAPALGFPLEFDQGWSLAQISVPVFAGFLATATQFATAQHGGDDEPAPPLLAWLIFGPASIYLLGATAVLFVFWSTNRADAPLGSGMGTQLLSTILTALLGLVTITSNIAIARLFRKEGS